MHPLIKFHSGVFLHKSIFRTTYPSKKLDTYVIHFDEYFREKEKVILEAISNVTGLAWTMRQIDVYLFDAWFPSISFPLCLNYYKGDKEFSLFCLIHELTHNILFYNWEDVFGNLKIDQVEIEAICEFVTKAVCKKFFSDTTINHLVREHEFDGYYKCVWEREKELEKEMGHMNVREFYLESFRKPPSSDGR